MESRLRIDGRSFGWDFRGLWWLILGHTGCARSTADILIALTDAVREGPLEHFEIYRTDGSAGPARWEVRFVTQPEPDLAALPARR